LQQLGKCRKSFRIFMVRKRRSHFALRIELKDA